jgi:hypothetical protein
MSTIREWLNDAEFDWETGTIVYQEVSDEDSSPGWTDPSSASVIAPDHPILGKSFHSGYGGPECPRFVAKDDRFIYFPGQYDGSTWLEKVSVNITFYLDPKNPSPYPGS